jgi:hypothetical protein
MRLAGNAEISSSMRQQTIVRSGFFPLSTRIKGLGAIPLSLGNDWTEDEERTNHSLPDA